MGGEQASLLPGYCLKAVDGTYLKGADRRLNAIRNLAGSALPGKAIVVLEPLSKLFRRQKYVRVASRREGRGQKEPTFKNVGFILDALYLALRLDAR